MTVDGIYKVWKSRGKWWWRMGDDTDRVGPFPTKGEALEDLRMFRTGD